MARVVEWQLPYTWWTGIEIDANKVIKILLRDEDNLIQVNNDNELYTDLQLADWIKPTDSFPVWVTVGKVLASDWWWESWMLLNLKTTSWDYVRWIYWQDNKLYIDRGTGTYTQIYTKPEVDALFTQLRGELATVAFTWDYNDLINRPAFLQEQADWEQTDTDAPDYIKNKPTIPTVNDATLTIQKNWIGLGSFTANSSTNTTVNIPVPWVIDNVSSTSTTDALSANQGKELQDQIDGLKAMGRFLSLWNSATWLPISFPLDIPYNYKTWDYFLVETVSSATPAVNYRPTGLQYTWTASSTVETEEVAVGDLYLFDGSTWLLQINHGKSVGFANIAWQPSDNAALDAALDAKQDVLTAWTWISISNNTVSNTGVTSVNWNTWAVTIAVNDWTLAINQWWTSKWTFTANQSGASTVDLETTIPVTQSWYDALPSSKTSDWNLYLIYW